MTCLCHPEPAPDSPPGGPGNAFFASEGSPGGCAVSKEEQILQPGFAGLQDDKLANVVWPQDDMKRGAL